MVSNANKPIAGAAIASVMSRPCPLADRNARISVQTGCDTTTLQRTIPCNADTETETVKVIHNSDGARLALPLAVSRRGCAMRTGGIEVSLLITNDTNIVGLWRPVGPHFAGPRRANESTADRCVWRPAPETVTGRRLVRYHACVARPTETRAHDRVRRSIDGSDVPEGASWECMRIDGAQRRGSDRYGR